MKMMSELKKMEKTAKDFLSKHGQKDTLITGGSFLVAYFITKIVFSDKEAEVEATSMTFFAVCGYLISKLLNKQLTENEEL